MNTALVVLLQFAASRLGKTLARAAWAELFAGIVVAVACVLLGRGGLVTQPAAAIALLAAGIVLLTLGEVAHSAASWSIAYALAGERSRTRSLAVFGLRRGGALVVGPLIITVVVLGNGIAGWLAGAGRSEKRPDGRDLGAASGEALTGPVSRSRTRSATDGGTVDRVPELSLGLLVAGRSCPVLAGPA